MLQKLFNPDNALMITMSQITDCIFLSLFWLLGCVPLVTVGASSAALYDAAFRAFRQGDKHSWRRFFETFRRNWKAGILPSLVFLLSGILSRSPLLILSALLFAPCHFLLSYKNAVLTEKRE